MNQQTLSTTKMNIYKPTFDLETGKYIDEAPMVPRQILEFKCLCNQKTFNTLTKFKTHIALKGHQRYVSCYLEHMEDANDVKEEMMRLRTKYEINERKLKMSLKTTEEKLELAQKTIQEFINSSHSNHITQSMNLD